jgi:hypothetical protein
LGNLNKDLDYGKGGLVPIMKQQMSIRAWHALDPNRTMSFANKDFEVNLDEKLN